MKPLLVFGIGCTLWYMAVALNVLPRIEPWYLVPMTIGIAVLMIWLAQRRRW